MATVFLLPGLLCDESVWAAQRALLSAEHDVRVANFYGFSSLTKMAQSVLDTAPEKFCIAGHSMGGRVALEICRLAPGRVQRVAIMDAGIHAPASEEKDRRMALVELARREGMEIMARRWLWPMIHPDHVSDKALMEPLVAMIARATPEIFLGQQTALLSRDDATPTFRALTCPVLIVCGRQDQWSTLAQHQEMAKLLPAAKLEIIEEGGHMVMNEQPERTAEVLRDFFAGA